MLPVRKAKSLGEDEAMRKLLLALLVIEFSGAAGQNVLLLQTVLDSVIATHPAIKVSDAGIRQQQLLNGAAVDLPNPTAEIEYLGSEGFTLYIEQEIEFPTVYTAQKDVERSRLKLLEGNRALSVYELKYEVSKLYTQWQYAYLLVQFLNEQDSIYNLLHDNARREFEAGLIDFVQVSFVNIRLQQIRLELEMARAEYEGLNERIRYLTGVAETGVPDTNLTFLAVEADTQIGDFPALQYNDLQIGVAEKMLQLEKRKALPGFKGGYLNSWSNDRPLAHGFSAGISIPVWFWQYKAATRSAALQVDIDRYTRELKALSLNTDLHEAIRKYQSYLPAIAAYDSAGIKSINDLQQSAQRFFAAGRTGYTELLRSFNEAADLRRTYIELIKNHNETVLQIKYLKGEL